MYFILGQSGLFLQLVKCNFLKYVLWNINQNQDKNYFLLENIDKNASWGSKTNIFL